MQEAPNIDLRGLAPGLCATCGDYLQSYRRGFEEAVARGEPGVVSSRRFAAALDGLLSALFCAGDAAAGATPGARLALVGVGGYGRGLVGLHSDVDVLLLSDDPTDARVQRVAEALLYPLWDIGLDIGHAVRGVDETVRLAREDLRTATTLLDLRRVAGDASIVAQLRQRAHAQVFGPHLTDFLDMLERDTERRHERFGDSLYLLEPDVKLGRGGLRDLDVATWAARARWGVRSDEPFVRTGVLLRREFEDLQNAQEFLWRVRNYLHRSAGRAQDRLTFADQEEIAIELGFVDGVVLAVEQFMQAYYRHARTVAQVAERTLDRARPPRRRNRATQRELGDGTALFDGRITLADSGRLKEEPALALRLYRQVLAQQKAPYSFARDAVARIAVDEAWAERLRASTEAQRLFIELLATTRAAPVRRGSLLDELHEVGLTVAMIPELEPLTGRVHHDVYHVYTVDVHLVRAVDRLREIFAGQLARDLPLASRLAAEAPRRRPLFLATFLHAMGKVHGRDRPDRGATLARPIAERLGFGPADVDHVAWLIAEQRSLYHWATRRDTSDPLVLAELAARVQTKDRLRDLYLLTVAILSTTNPTALTAWKARMLEDLYVGLLATLEGEEGPSAGRAARVCEEVRVGFVGDKERARLEEFLARVPERYVLANPADVIRRHARIYRDAVGSLTLALGPGPSEELSELVLLTDDRPGLLADVAALLAAHRVGVVDAQIYTLGDHRAFDVFLVRSEARSGRGAAQLAPPLDAAALRHLEVDLRALLAGEVSVEDLLARVPREPSWAQRHSPDVPTEVSVDNEASPRFTVVDVFTRDRVGVLQAIAQTLHSQGLSIALSKVNTEGERVADVFYVQDASGGKVRDPERLAALREALHRRLQRLHAEHE